MALGGAILRISQTILRALQLCCSILVLGIFSYYLAVLARNDVHIASWLKAVEGMSGAAVLYGIFAVLLTICLAGVSFFASLAVFFDLCFVGCFAAIAYYNRGGAHSCRGFVNTPLGSGMSVENLHHWPSLHLACRLSTVVFAVSIINIFLFLLTAVLQVLLARHSKKDSAFGPSPGNNYTSGATKVPFWKRNKQVHNTRDAEMATAGTGTGTVRTSHETALTGSTMGNTPANVYAESKYGQVDNGHHHRGAATNY